MTRNIMMSGTRMVFMMMMMVMMVTIIDLTKMKMTKCHFVKIDVKQSSIIRGHPLMPRNIMLSGTRVEVMMIMEAAG